VELREEQVTANRRQAAAMGVAAEWILGDGRDVDTLVGEPADFIMCCPPYYDLEVYSDDAADISTEKEYAGFMDVLADIISKCVSLLRDDRFACFVVSDIRDKKGIYRQFNGDVIRAFVAAGAGLYNDAILIHPAGSLPIRVGRQFMAGRKLGRTHENVLVFCKGNPKRATEACGEIDFVIPDGEQAEWDSLPD
jgi:hypothetical protein